MHRSNRFCFNDIVIETGMIRKRALGYGALRRIPPRWLDGVRVSADLPSESPPALDFATRGRPPNNAPHLTDEDATVAALDSAIHRPTDASHTRPFVAP